MARKQYSAEEKAAYREKKKAETDSLFADIEVGVKEFVTSDKYKSFLDYVSRFRTYSPNNVILIARQNPDASLVASFSKWKELGRSVNKGEHGMTILKPVFEREEVIEKKTVKDKYGNVEYNDDGTEKTVNEVKKKESNKLVGFTTMKVFDVSQTSGKPIPEIVSPLPETVTKEYADVVSGALDKLTKIKHEFEKMPEGHNGYYSFNLSKIALNEDHNASMQIKTHIHEAAHCLLHNRSTGSQKERSKEEKEVQAESVAYVVSKRLGLDTSDYSFGYIASWNNFSAADLMSIIRETRLATEAIYTAVDNELKAYAKGIVLENENKQDETITDPVMLKETFDRTADGFVWKYYNPDGNDGNGQFIEYHITEEDISAAVVNKHKAELAGVAEPRAVFTNTLIEKCKQYLIDNDASDVFLKYKAEFLSDTHDLNIPSEFLTKDTIFSEKLIVFLSSGNAEYEEIRRKERLAEYRPINTVMAVQMWENGFGLLNADGYELPLYKNENSDYTAFEDKKDNSFYVLPQDYRIQQLYDEITEYVVNISEVEEYSFYKFFDNYDDSFSLQDNVQTELSSNEDLSSLAEYFYEVGRESYDSDSVNEVYNAAQNGQAALEELEKELKNRQRDNGDVIDLTQQSGRGRK